MEHMKRKVFYISDSTGITAETLGHSLLSQFPQLEWESETLRFVDDRQAAEDAKARIKEAVVQGQDKPVVFSTVLDAELRGLLEVEGSLFIDFMAAFISPLEQELGVRTSQSVGYRHRHDVEHGYGRRIEAMNFSLQCDDGVGTQRYDQADVILVGVSRSGKTPTALYLALNFGIFTANYPLVEEDLDRLQLPATLKPYRHKLFGLRVSPERLHQIRSERRPDSQYASLQQCAYEVRQIDALFRQAGIPYVDVTTMSVEEIAATIVKQRPNYGAR
jgi:regulator of PEP synthase PpsR (kinase-PPPase family)